MCETCSKSNKYISARCETCQKLPIKTLLKMHENYSKVTIKTPQQQSVEFVQS